MDSKFENLAHPVADGNIITNLICVFFKARKGLLWLSCPLSYLQKKDTNKRKTVAKEMSSWLVPKYQMERNKKETNQLFSLIIIEDQKTPNPV